MEFSMAKKQLLDVANGSLDAVKAHLNKLKREEAKLEIALTLREFPEVEDMLVRLITCTVEIDLVSRSIRLESNETDAQEMKAKQAQIDLQVATLKAKLTTLVQDNESTRKLRTYYTAQIEKLQVDRFSAGMSKKNLKYLEHYESLLRKLRETYDKYVAQGKLPDNFDVFFHVPNLKKQLDIANDLIARKGA